MTVEAAKRGHELYFMLQEGLMWKGGRVVGEISRLTLTGEKDPGTRLRRRRKRRSPISTRC